MVSWSALLLLLVPAVVLYVGDGRANGETPPAPSTPPVPESIPAADVFAFKIPLREPVMPGGGFIEGGTPFDPIEWAIEDEGESEEESGEAGAALAAIASRTFGAHSMHALSGDLQNPPAFPHSTPGMFTGIGTTGGSMFGGPRSTSPDDLFETASEIANFETSGDPRIDAPPSLLSEILDNTGSLPLLPVLEALSAGRLLPLVDIPVPGLDGPTDVAFDPQDLLDPQGTAEQATPVPEPGTLLLLSGAIGSYVARRRLRS